MLRLQPVIGEDRVRGCVWLEFNTERDALLTFIDMLDGARVARPRHDLRFVLRAK